MANVCLGNRRWYWSLIGAVMLIVFSGCQQPKTATPETNPTAQSEAKAQQGGSDDTVSPASKVPSAAEQKPDSETAEIKLFDGKSLTGWDKIQFGGEGDIEIVDGEIRMGQGDPLTGIALMDDVEIPRTNYELSLKAMKRDGNDFFCGLTFPVGESYCSFIVGGWAGTLVGLSNLDGLDASDNGTRKVRKFERNQWYAIRVRVTPARITCWIDDEQFVDQSIVDREVSIRNDVITTTPIGICNFQTPNSIKDVTVQKLPPGS